MATNTLALMLGYRCNIQCRSCLWGEQHSQGPAIDPAEACEWIDEACEAIDVRLVGFSGGESFLYLKQMTTIADHCWKAHRLPWAISTNSFWATTEKRAERMLEPLASIGLQQLLLSIDDFHQEHVPLDRVGNALRAARRLGITPTLQSIVTRTSRRLDDFLKELGVGKDDGIRASEVFCTRMGWAATRIPESEFPSNPEALAGYCSMFGPLIIRPEGTVHLCCGPAFAIPSLAIGNLRTESLKEMLERAEWDPFFNALAAGNGPSLIAECLRAAGRGAMIRDAYSSSCEACHHILSAPGVDEFVRQELEPQRAELFLKRSILEQESAETLSALVGV